MQIIKYAKRIKPYVDGQWEKIIGSSLFALFLAGLKTSQAYIVKPIFDHGLSPNATVQEILWIVFFFSLIIIFNFPIRFFHFFWIRKVVTRAMCNVREDLNRKLSHLPLSFFIRNKQGVLISQIMTDTTVFSSGFRGVVDLIREPLTAILMLALALYRDWQLTMIIIGFTPLFYWVLTRSGKKVLLRQTAVQEKMADLTHAVTEGIGAQKLTKAFSLSKFINGRFKSNQEDFFKSQMKTMVIEEILHPVTEFITGLAFIGIIFFAHYRIQSGAMTPGDFVSFMTAMALIVDPVRKYAVANIRFNQAVAAGERVFKLLDEPNEVDEGQVIKDSFEGSIEVNNLSFSYVEEQPVLRGVDVSIKKSQKVAFVGMSGSGKSTLINLLLGLYPIPPGSILIDKHSIEEIKLDSLRSLFGFVSQDIFLFNDTILENLTLGKSFSKEKVEEAIRVAHAKEFIDQLPDGLNTLIGDRGAKLSGGQRQRLTIARAFLRNSDVLLFDEATSALDNESENVVQEALDEISKDKTVITVAHRLSTIQDFDKIYVFDQGKVVEEGTHEELINKKQYYFRLYELSKKG